MTGAPITNLLSGVRIANFSSPHPFTFDDGSYLEACSPERAKALMLEAVEEQAPNPLGRGIIDIKLTFRMSAAVSFELGVLEAHSEVDIVLVPLPVLQAAQESGFPFTKLRVCRVVDRVTKTISSTRFCR